MTPDLKADLLRLVDGVSAIGDASSLRARVQAATITEPGQADLNNPMVREPLERFLDDARQHAQKNLADEAQRLLRILKPPPPDPCVVECGRDPLARYIERLLLRERDLRGDQMTTPDTKQDHPGAEWVEHIHTGTERGYFFLPALPTLDVVGWSNLAERPAAIERCRAISAAALHWERQKADANGCAALLEQIARELELQSR